MSALRIHPRGEPVRFVDLGACPWVPIHGTATLRGHAVVGQSGEPSHHTEPVMTPGAQRNRAYRELARARKAGAA